MAKGSSTLFKGLFLTALLMPLVFVIACGSAAPANPSVADTGAAKAVPKEVTTQKDDPKAVEPAKEIVAPPAVEKKVHEGLAVHIAPGAKTEEKDNPYFTSLLKPSAAGSLT